MIRAGLVDKRNGRPSMSRLAEAADTHASTISAMMSGSRQTSPDIVERVAKALGMESQLAEVFAWVGRVRQVEAAFVPHPDAELLTSGERSVINELIRVMVAGRKSDPPAVITLEEARSAVADAELSREILPRALRPDLLTLHPDGTQTVWEISATSQPPRNRRNRMADALFLAQSVQNATGRATKAIVVEVPLATSGPRSLVESKRSAVDLIESATAQLAEAVGSGRQPSERVADEGKTLIEDEQGHPEDA